jgi:hypothetical protein
MAIVAIRTNRMHFMSRPPKFQLAGPGKNLYRAKKFPPAQKCIERFGKTCPIESCMVPQSLNAWNAGYQFQLSMNLNNIRMLARPEVL